MFELIFGIVNIIPINLHMLGFLKLLLSAKSVCVCVCVCVCVRVCVCVGYTYQLLTVVAACACCFLASQLTTVNLDKTA